MSRIEKERKRKRGTTLLFSVERIAANRGETKVILRSRRPVKTRPALNGSVIDYEKTTPVENRLDLCRTGFHAQPKGMRSSLSLSLFLFLVKEIAENSS